MISFDVRRSVAVGADLVRVVTVGAQDGGVGVEAGEGLARNVVSPVPTLVMILVQGYSHVALIERGYALS